MERKYIFPVIGRIYRNRNGSDYLCTQVLRHAQPSDSLADFERITDGWCLTAHGVVQYEDGTIEWNYSSGGRWVQKLDL